MNLFKAILLLGIVIPTCPENEHMSACSNTCEATCENLNPVCTKECRIGHTCTCNANFVRQKGACIPKAKCPKCKRNESYKTCGSACPSTCRNPNSVGVFCEDLCVEGCFCNEDYTQDNMGRCEKIERCKNFDCGAYEKFSMCGSACGSGCKGSSPSPCKAMCYPGCFCVIGYIRDDVSGKCIKNSKC